MAGWPRQLSPLGPIGVPVAPRRRQQPATGRGWWPPAVLSRPAPGLSRGGEPGQGRSVGEGPPVGGRGDLVGRGGGGRRSEVEVEGNGLGARAAVKIRQFASGRFAGSRIGMGEGIGMGPHTRALWCRWLGAASGDPRMNVHIDTHIYTYIHIYIHTHHVTGWEMVRSPGHSIYISADTVGVTPRRPYLGGTVPGVRCRFGGMMPNARRRGGGYPGCPPKDHVTFVIFQTTKSTQILGFSPTGPLFTM